MKGTAAKGAALGLERLRADEELRGYIEMADEHMERMGFTEHGLRHVNLVSHHARRLLRELGYDERLAELAGMAGYLHDVGNMLGRSLHGQTGALMSWQLLREMGLSWREVGLVIAAVGNHEEEYGVATSPVAAAVIIADKADVHRSRVRNRDLARFDIHDRVNFAVERSELRVDPEPRRIELHLHIDTAIAPVMEYFEIFLERMVMCRRAADVLGARFRLTINEVELL